MGSSSANLKLTFHLDHSAGAGHLMVWVYYDESGEYSRFQEPGTLMNMSVGGCIAPLEAWKSFEAEWKQALNDEGLPFFHMTEYKKLAPQMRQCHWSRAKTYGRHSELFGSSLGSGIWIIR